MSAPGKFRHARGFLLAELIVSIAIAGMIVMGLVISMQGAAAFNKYQWSRQQCIAAAQAQIDTLTATGTPLADEEIQRLWPKVTVVVERSAGQGQWAGLELVQVTARMKVTARPAQVRLARYVQPPTRAVAGGASL